MYNFRRGFWPIGILVPDTGLNGQQVSWRVLEGLSSECRLQDVSGSCAPLVQTRVHLGATTRLVWCVGLSCFMYLSFQSTDLVTHTMCGSFWGGETWGPSSGSSDQRRSYFYVCVHGPPRVSETEVPREGRDGPRSTRRGKRITLGDRFSIPKRPTANCYYFH